jgi:DNA-binding NarL/FixJ family response regulator
MSIKVAIVEDDAPVRDSWGKLVATQSDFECVGSFGTGEAALARLPEVTPNVVLMDINLPGISGIECTARLREMLPQTQVLMVTVYADNEHLFEALKVGASGYLLKCTDREELARSIREVAGGGAAMNSSIARRVIEAFRKPTGAKAASLSPREKDVLGLLAKGMAAKDIARQLNTSHETVRVHLRHIYEKLHVHCREDAIAKYLSGVGQGLQAPRPMTHPV